MSMGIPRMSLTERQRELMAPVDRKELGIEAPSETRQRMLRKLEREEQNTLVGWLVLRERDDVLTYDWSRTDRKTTNRKGMPDFRLYAEGRALLGEMKVGGAKLSDEQVEMIEKFGRSGTEVQIWHSAAQAIEAIREWLISLPV